jgi:hypothetical protein
MSNEPISMDDELAPLDMDAGEGTPTGGHKIQAFGGSGMKTERAGGRKPHITGAGAVKVKTFYTKLRADAIEFMDEQVNTWLEQHPEYEVKFVSSTIGPMVGKTTEPALIVSVWV